MSTINGRGLRERVAKTASYTIQAPADNGKTFTNQGATGAVTFTLPAATPGQWYRFAIATAGQNVEIVPQQAEFLALPATGALQSAGLGLITSGVGKTIAVACVKAGEWYVTEAIGSWPTND